MHILYLIEWDMLKWYKFNLINDYDQNNKTCTILLFYIQIEYDSLIANLIFLFYYKFTI